MDKNTETKTTTKPEPKTHAQLYAPLPLRDNEWLAKARITPTPGKSKRPGSASAARYALYAPGMSPAAALLAGVRSADLRWDVAHGLITIAA